MKMRNEYTCSLELTHDAIRGKWKPIILRQLGKSPQSLSFLRHPIAGVIQKMLIQQLSELIQYGFVDKTIFEEYPLQMKCDLTDRGRRIFQAVTIMQDVRIEMTIEDHRENTLEEKGLLQLLKSAYYLFNLAHYIMVEKEVKAMRDTETATGNLIDKQGVSFIGSVSPDGIPNIKAMLPPRKREGIKAFYFTASTPSMRVSQHEANPRICIYFCDRRFFRGVMLTGTMEVLEDRKTKEMIWREGDTIYYSRGVADPDYCVLRFTANDGRYYGNFGSKSFEIEQVML